MWYECAKSSQIDTDGTLVQDVPPTCAELDEWLEKYTRESDLQLRVWNRYILTGGRSIQSWAKRQFFFRNANATQLSQLHAPC